MKEKNKNILLLILGTFLIFFGLLAIINAYFFKNDLSMAFWFCYSAMILVGIGIIIKSSFLIAAQINILGIPLLLWNLDFIYFLFTKKSIFGLVDYFFVDPLGLSKIISLEHLLILPIAVYTLYLIKLKRKDFWKLSLLEIVIIYFATLIFTDPTKDINCVFQSCFSFIGNFLYPLVWFSLGLCIIVLTNLLLSNLKLLNVSK